MAIDLLNSFLQKGQRAAAQPQKDIVMQTNQAAQAQVRQLARAVQALQAGQTVQGEILSVKGEEVQLSLLNDLILDARLEQSISLTPGTLMAFQVKSNNSAGLSLMPLFTNTAVDPNAMKALDMAGIPVTDRTLEMVTNMMGRGLPVGRQPLQEAYRDVMTYKDSPVGDIISLRQLKLPVTQENLSQLNHYENNQHFLSNTFSDIGQAISRQLLSWVQNGAQKEAGEFLSQLKEIFSPSLKGEQSVQMETAEIGAVSSQGAEEGKGLINESDILRTINHPIELSATLEETVVMGEKELNPQQKMVMQKEGAEGEKQAQNIVKGRPADLQNSLDQLIQLLSQGKASVKDISVFGKIWNHRFQPQLMMQPEEVMEKEQVQEFYEKLSNQIQQLGNLVNEHGQASSSLGKAVQNTVSNLDFMNQINQMHAYIQLPLKLSGQQAKGELYVFTNRRSMAEKEGKVTALLHLDMEYLGKLDVYVALENQKVSTQFYLEKEEYLDFLEQHMDMLSGRLNKRGYECSIKTCLRREEEQSVMERIINHQSQPFLLATQAFDMRV